MPIEPDNNIRVQFHGRIFNQQIVLDLAYTATVGSVASVAAVLGEVNDTVQAVGTNIVGAYLACMPPQYTLEEIRSQLVFPVRSAYVPFFPIAAVGTNAANASVGNDAAALTRRTNAAGRSQISTLKIGPVPDSVSVAGRLTDAYRTLLETLGTETLKTLVLPVTGAQFAPTILNQNNASLGRLLTTRRVGVYSRVNRRRTVGIGS